MKWSLKIARIAGIEIRLHFTFLIFIAWLLGASYLSDRNAAASLAGVGFVLILFLIVLLHELGHAFAAKRYGIRTEDITLLPIGGVARLQRLPDDPKQELVVALAGPAVNVVLAAALYAWLAISTGPQALFTVSVGAGNIVARLIWLNVWLAGFNLLPAFPMDGGRVLRAFLSIRLGRLRATEIAATIGQGMAMLFAFAGFYSNPFLLFIALFVWLGAEGEAQQVKMQTLLGGVKAGDVMATKFRAVSPRHTLGSLAKDLVPGFQSDYPVLDDGKLIGFVGLEDVVKGISEEGPDTPVEKFTRKEFATIGSSEEIQSALSDWQENEGTPLAVMDDGKLVGLVTMSNVGEHLMIKSALASGHVKRASDGGKNGEVEEAKRGSAIRQIHERPAS